jgi:acyl carrier protein
MKNINDIINEITPIFQDVLDQPDLSLTASSSAENVADWDSLAHIGLVMSIEKHYKISFGLAELQDLKDVGEMANLIIKKIG